MTYVVAAGNSNADFATFVPAAYHEALTVTAMADFNGQPGGGAPATCRADVDDTAADFSNFTTAGSSDVLCVVGAPVQPVEAKKTKAGDRPWTSSSRTGLPSSPRPARASGSP